MQLISVGNIGRAEHPASSLTRLFQVHNLCLVRGTHRTTSPSLFSSLLTNIVFLITAKKDVEDLLKASGVTADAESLTVMMKKLEGKSIPELIAEGQKDLAVCGGGAAAAGGAAAGGAAEAAPEPEKKEEEPEEDVDMGDLFGGGEDDY